MVIASNGLNGFDIVVMKGLGLQKCRFVFQK